MIIKCTCIWIINTWGEYELTQCDPVCACEGHRIMASYHLDDGTRGGS